MKKNTTIVTGLWDLGRGNLTGWAKRDFNHYRDRFFDLLKCDANMCIWIPRDLEAEVWTVKGRTKENTKIYYKELADFKSWFPFFDRLQEIRTDPKWKNYAGWLTDSPQATLELYNPMMMCKMFMVNDSAILDPFNSRYFYWLDGGITNTVGTGYFTNDKVLDKLAGFTDSIDKFLVLTYPYTGNDEIHGFERKAMARYCNTDFVGYVARGGFWGGKKDVIHRINDLYYGILSDTMKEGVMGADECLFTILAHRHTDLVHRFDIGGNGLVWPFFEQLKNFVEPKVEDFVIPKPNTDEVEYIQTAEEIKLNRMGEGTSLYIVTFNSPPQLQLLFDSIESANPELLKVESKFLIDNSIDTSTKGKYNTIAKKYGFEVIRQGNLGVCGARAWAAQHFHDGDTRYMVWFEDDMLLVKEPKLCKNGFNMHVDGWLKKGIRIVEEEHLDFLKMSFSEFYGDHHKQWSWHNVPKDVKEKYFPDGTCRMKWKESGCIDGLSYLIGEVYYSNWPSIMTKAGNYKIFLETKYASPFEQTIMSHSFQLTKTGRMRSGVLMASLINHNRVHHYSKDIRKEC